MYRVQIFKGDELCGEVDCDKATAYLGKDAGSLAPMRGWRLGKRQLQLDVREDALFLKDAGGLGPVKVNGNAVNEYGPLRSTDVIEVGDYTVRFNI